MTDARRAAGPGLSDRLGPGRARVVLSWGMGVDSTAVLVRWLLDPSSRGFPLDDLAVVVAQTGDEWPVTAELGTAVLQLLRRHRVRLVQVARAGRYVTRAGDGVAVLDDSTTPTTLHTAGAYRLSQELLAAGTVPQMRRRLCSLHAKGDVLDPTIAAVTHAGPYRHAVGFEVSETRRIHRDRTYDTATRHGWYPLAEWGWDRQVCLDYLQTTLGLRWQRSACTYCPFAMTNRAGRARVLAGFHADPETAVLPLLVEHVALAMNHRQGLIAGRRLVDLLRQQEMTGVLDRFDAHVTGLEHGLYEVRRVYRPGGAARSVRRHKAGSRPEMLLALHQLAHRNRPRITGARLDLPGPPGTEHFFVVAPATVSDKTPPAFERAWSHLAGASALSGEQPLAG